jgi:Uma2 family endonuclease
MSVSQRQPTLEEFLRLPETKPASEYVDGRIEQKPMPQGKHSALQMEWASWFRDCLKPSRLGRSFTELRCTFAGRSLVPDVSCFIDSRIPRDAAGEMGEVFRLAPDIAVEIISPKQSAAGLRTKLSFCVANGVSLGLLVDPYEKTITVFAPDAAPRTLRQGPIDFGAVFPGVAVTVEAVWGWLR